MAETTAKPGKLKEYFKGVKTELKKVVWPTKNEAIRHTGIVIGVCAFFALLFWLLDTTFLALLEQILNVSM